MPDRLASRWGTKLSFARWAVFAMVAVLAGLQSVDVSAAQDADVKASERAALTIGETFTIESTVLNEVRRINVYLPAPYTQSAELRLPVLYMPDGGMGEDFLHIAGLLQVLIGNGSMRPFVLVGIENTERRRDLTGPTQNEDDKNIAPRVGESAAFREFLRRELMPVVDLRYRTTDESAIIGESLAGLFIIETMFAEPDLFDAYIAFDPSLWWNDSEIIVRGADRLKAIGDRPIRLHLAASGDEELAGPARKFVDVLTSSAPDNLAWSFESMPEETHATIYHSAALKALRRLFPPQSSER